MKFSIRIVFALLLCSQLSPPYLYAFDQESMQLYQEMLKNSNPQMLNEELIKKCEKLTLSIDAMLEEIACLVEPGALGITDKKLKEELLQNIIATRSQLGQLRLTFIGNPFPSQLQEHVTTLKALLAHVKKAIKNDFKDFTAFVPTRSIAVEQLESDELEQLLDETNTSFETIKKEASDLGLTSWNRFYRKYADPIVAFCDKHNAHTKTLWTLGAVGVGAYLWYRMSESLCGLTPDLMDAKLTTDQQKLDNKPIYSSYNENDSIPTKIVGWINDKWNCGVRSVMGWKPTPQMRAEEAEIRSNMNTVHQISSKIKPLAQDNEDVALAMDAISSLSTTEKMNHPVKLFGQLENEIISYRSGYWAIGTLPLWQPYLATAMKKYDEMKLKAVNFARRWHNNFKGGIYKLQFKELKYEKDFEIHPRYTFDDIVGLDGAKHQFEKLLTFLKHPEEYARRGISPDLTHLLYGPPRTGKSMLAEAFAGEMKKIYGSQTKYYEIPPGFLAQAGSFDYLLGLAKSEAPCVIFIDELDMLNLNKRVGQDNLRLQEFQQCIDGCLDKRSPEKPVVILAATNYPEDLNHALLARFTSKIPFELPSFFKRLECFARELEQRGLPLQQFDAKKLAERTEQCTYFDIHNIIERAQFMTREQGRPMTQADIEHVLYEKIYNIIFHDEKFLKEHDKNILSAHIAGHTVANLLFESRHERVSLATIRPIKMTIEDTKLWNKRLDLKDKNYQLIQFGRIVTHRPVEQHFSDDLSEEDNFRKNFLCVDSLELKSRNEYKRQACIALAGHLTEELLFNNKYVSEHICSGQDMARAYYWAEQYCLDGREKQQVAASKKQQEQLREEVNTLIQECIQETKALLAEAEELIMLLMGIFKEQEIVTNEMLEGFVHFYHEAKEKGCSMEEVIKESMQAMMAGMQGDDQALRAELGIPIETA